MPKRKANALWTGNLTDGNGTVALQSGAFEGAYSFSSRFEEGTGTNPEELVAAAHAGCFSMALSAELGKNGFDPKSVETQAVVHLEKSDAGFGIPKIELICNAVVPGIDEQTFLTFAEGAKKNCPISKLLTGAEITLQATLSN